jgi:hypothetical protein
MSDDLRGAIEKAEKALAVKMAEVKKIKTTINGLHELLGEAGPYAEDEAALAASTRIRRDQFFGKPPIVAVKEFLEISREPRSTEQILTGLATGGFDLEMAGWTEATKLRALAITLSKNSSVFVRLNDGYVGLVKWYPEAAEKRKARRGTAGDAANGTADPDEPDENEGSVEAAPAPAEKGA